MAGLSRSPPPGFSPLRRAAPAPSLRASPVPRAATPRPDHIGEAYANGGFGGVPASDAAIAGLQRQEYDGVPRKKRSRRGSSTGRSGATTNTVCPICLEEFEIVDDLLGMPCVHLFHKVCLVNWLKLSRLCPFCRYALPSEEDEAKKRGDQGVEEGPAGRTPTPRGRGTWSRQANVRGSE